MDGKFVRLNDFNKETLALTDEQILRIKNEMGADVIFIIGLKEGIGVRTITRGGTGDEGMNVLIEVMGHMQEELTDRLSKGPNAGKHYDYEPER